MREVTVVTTLQIAANLRQAYARAGGGWIMDGGNFGAGLGRCERTDTPLTHRA